MEDLILKGDELKKKLLNLKKIQVDTDYYRTFYMDENTCEKWVYEHLFPDGPPQLRMINQFPWEDHRKEQR